MTEYDRMLHTDGSFLKEEADRILLKSHEMVHGVLAAGGLDARSATLEQLTDAVGEALCRTIIRLEAQAREAEQLRHDLERQMTIANEHVNEVERLREAVEKERAAIVAFLRETIFNCTFADIPSAIEAGEHLK